MTATDSATPSSVRSGKPSVLFVDDEKRVLNSMRAMFRRDYNLFLTTRGDEALKIIDENDIDVVVADQRMPIMTGVEVLTAVKQSSPDTVRILLTGYADLDAIEGAMNDGEVFRFLSKPCAAEELRGTIKLATEIAIETTGSSSLDEVDDDSFLEAIVASGVDTSVVEQLSDADVDTEIDTTLELSDEADSSDAPKLADPVISQSASVVLSDETEQAAALSEEEIEAQATASAILDDAMAPSIEAPDHSSTAVIPEEYQGESEVEIVMSGDTHEVVDNSEDQGDFGGTTAVLDVAATLEAPQEEKKKDPNPVKLVGTGKYKVSIIVFTSDEQFAKSIGRSLQDYFYTFQASNIARLMHGIQKIAPAVLITDVSEDPEVIEQLAAQLKQKVPEMVTMVASQHRDADLMVRLINHGQVFRMVDKPMSSTACKRHVREAIKKHIQLRDNPDLIQRHQVLKSGGGKLPASIGRLINGLGRVRGLWSRKVH
ncbi:MAG: response regulator [Pseudomonadota bacterium]